MKRAEAESLNEIARRVRERAETVAGDDDELDFYSAAIALGCAKRLAERVTELLNERVMRARGAL